MKAAILAVGSELLGEDRLDTNSLRITGALAHRGVQLVRKAVVGDDEAAIASSLADLARDADLVLVTGGLGPTLDDRTREALCLWTGAELQLDDHVLEQIVTRYRAADRRMPEVNRRQAMVPAGATVLDNDRGTAPGLRIEQDGCCVFLFPGVPRELDGMIDRHLEPWLERTLDSAADRAAVVEMRELRVACMPESWVEERLGAAYAALGRDSIAVLASPGEVKVRISARGSAASRSEQLARGVALIRELIGEPVFTDCAETLEETVGRELANRSATLAVGESCTGGLIGERLTSIAGSSAYFVGGAISYSNRLKTDLLGVPAELIESLGAVSEQVAAAMASGARTRFGATFGLSVTGVAGPGGGSVDKPVGTVCFGIAGPSAGPGGDSARGDSARGGVTCLAQTARFPGDRAIVRRQAGQYALELARRFVTGKSVDILSSLRTPETVSPSTPRVAGGLR